MIATSPLDSASSWLWWSNIVYIGGAALTLGAAMVIFMEKRLIASGRRTGNLLITEFVVIGAAFVSLLGTTGAVHFGNTVSNLKDAELAAYEKAADLKIAQEQTATAIANQKAEEAKREALQTSQSNAELHIEVNKQEKQRLTAEAQLREQNTETMSFAHSLAQQQATMAEQAKVSPVLNAAQIEALSRLLSTYAGQDVILHSTPDTTVLRLKVSIAEALSKAGITFKQNSTDMGSLYQGISVVVHSPQDVPPLANALVAGIRQAGIEVHPVALVSVPPGRVALYLGPN